MTASVLAAVVRLAIKQPIAAIGNVVSARWQISCDFRNKTASPLFTYNVALRGDVVPTPL